MNHKNRNEKIYKYISEYIINNPLKWEDNELNIDKSDGNDGPFL